jgi:pimeloyl-ACP methyl ester carboxylesterase
MANLIPTRLPTRRSAFVVVALSSVLLLAACELRVAPAATDPGITRALGDHLVEFDQSRPLGNELFVFLPGTGSTAEDYRSLLQAVAADGMPAIGLNYPNSRTVESICQADGNGSDCYEEVRREIVYGVDTSPLVSVSRANSIVNRLVKLLQHLQWSQYLSGTQPRWDHIVIAGHSQGGGHAALLARDHTVARAVFFASPTDWSSTGTPDWLVAPSATPLDRYFGFVHTADHVTPLLNWAAMGVPGSVTSVDGADAPYGGAHRLTTSADVSFPHGAVAVNAHLYADVWTYLCCGPS